MNSKFSNFIKFLNNRLLIDMPGESAHVLMSPVRQNEPFRFLTPPPDVRPSAVLVLLFPSDESEEINILLTLRSSKLKSHKGQISFPGGRTENNETPIQTALREANEEVGLEPGNINIIGVLSSLFVHPSKSIISPVLAFTDSLPELTLNDSEVEEIIILPLSKLLETEFQKKDIWNINLQDVEVPYWNIHRTTPLWGATAMILMELIVLYREFENISG